MQPWAFLGPSYGDDDGVQQPAGCVAACAQPSLLLQGHASTIYEQRAAGKRTHAPSEWYCPLMAAEQLAILVSNEEVMESDNFRG